MMTNCTKAIILARVSSKEQEEQGSSIPAQVDRLMQYAQKMGFQVLKSYELTESSTKDNRKKFEKLLKLVEEQNEPIAIVTDTVDRLQRSFKESVELDLLRKTGKIELHFNRENLVIHRDSNSSEIMRWDMAVMFAKMYVLQLSDNVKRSNQKKREMGEWCGPAPIGYQNITRENGRKDIILDPERAPHVKKCFEMYASGNQTFQSIAKQMRKDGFTSPKSGNPRTKGQMQEMIANPFYYGMMEVKGKLYKHKYPSLIEKWVYDKCEDLREGRNQNSVKYKSKDFCFRSLLNCGQCGCTITLDETVKPNGTIYRYCKCPNTKGSCKGQKPIRIEVLLEQMEKLLDELKVPEHLLEEITLELKKGHETESEIYKNNLNRLHLELDKLKKRKDTAYLDRLDGRITTDEYDNIVATFQADEQDIQEELTDATKQDNTFLNSSLMVLDLAQKAGQLFKDASETKKHKILNLVTSNLSLKNGVLVYDLREPFDVLLNLSKTKEWLPGSDSNRRPIG